MAQQIVVTPKLAWLQAFVVPKKTVVITTEDLDFWKTKDVVINPSDPILSDITILAEALQKEDNPVDRLVQAGVMSPKIIVLVPNEWSWPPDYKPFANLAHKQKYDAELLARHLEEAGLLYVIRLLEFSGWSFLTAEASKA